MVICTLWHERASSRMSRAECAARSEGTLREHQAGHSRPRPVNRPQPIPATSGISLVYATRAYPRFLPRCSMVRRGSTVRVRQRASQRPRKRGPFSSDRAGLLSACSAAESAMERTAPRAAATATRLSRGAPCEHSAIGYQAQLSTLQPAPTHDRLSLTAAPRSRATRRRWRLDTAGARSAGRPGSLRPSSPLASRPGQAQCPGRRRGTAACPGRGPRGR